MYLLNYFIENGSFANLSKRASRLYKAIVEYKKADYPDMSVADYLELKLLPHREGLSLDTRSVRMLREYFSKKSELDKTQLGKPLLKVLTNMATSKRMSLDNLLKAINNVKIFPELFRGVRHGIDPRDYNNLLTSIALSMLIESSGNQRINLEVLRDYTSFSELQASEPHVAEYLQSKVPIYKGALEGDDLSLKLEGCYYYGNDLHLSGSLGLLNDFIFYFHGFMTTINISPSIAYKLSLMKEVSGNLNRIGLDEMNLLAELDAISLTLGFSSIKELLSSEGIEFTPVDNAHANYLPHGNNLELILDDYHEGQIIIDPMLSKMFRDMKVEDTLTVATIPYQNQSIDILAFSHNDKPFLAHSLLTRNNAIRFRNNNTLDLTAKNLI